MEESHLLEIVLTVCLPPLVAFAIRWLAKKTKTEDLLTREVEDKIVDSVVARAVATVEEEAHRKRHDEDVPSGPEKHAKALALSVAGTARHGVWAPLEDLDDRVSCAVNDRRCSNPPPKE